MHPFLRALPLLLLAWPAAAQSPAPSSPGPDSDALVVQRSLLDAIRQDTQQAQKNGAVMDTFSNRLERLEAAARSVPPSVEGLRTDIIAIRAALDRLVAAAATKRSAVTLKFAPFACGNEAEAACAVSACKSVGYANGISVMALRTGAGAQSRTTSIAEATCFD